VDFDEGPDEDEPISPWLPPDDRLWRHPSELAGQQPVGGLVSVDGAGGVGTAVRGTVHQTDRRLWTVAVLAGVVGALLASSAGVMTGEYNRSTTVVRPIEQIVDPASTYVTLADPRSEGIGAIAARLGPTIVQLVVSVNGANTTGSGVIFRSDGYILTNDHIVEGAQSVVAVMSDGARVSCRLVGADAATDLAVVKLDNSKPEAVATLGSSTELQVGQLAIAIGSPIGTAGGDSVTSGIISATDRHVASGNGPALLDMIQTDVAVAPSSSGGALVDGTGMVVGITNAIPFGDQGMNTLGFATPIDVAQDVANQILTTGTVTHAWLGIEGANVDMQTARTLGITGGAEVQNVDEGSPADRAGLTATDVVTALAGQPVNSMSDLEAIVTEERPGQRVDITFIHDGQDKTAQVILIELPSVYEP
jgi:S1-C subfamily serine protease